MHVTILKKGKLPEISRCTRCCNLYHCPFCERYKTSAKFSLDYHIGNHLKMALQHADFSIVKCSLLCREYAHFHCCYCPATLIRKKQLEEHLVKCKVKDTPFQDPPAPVKPTQPQIIFTQTPTPQLKLISQSLPLTSTVKLEPQFIPTTNLISHILIPGKSQILTNPPNASQASPSATVTSGQVPQKQTLKALEAKKNRVHCYHCDLDLNRKNLRLHLRRNHSFIRETITPKHHLRSQCIDGTGGIFAVQKSFRAGSVPIHVRKRFGDENVICDVEPCRSNGEFAQKCGLKTLECCHIESLAFCPKNASNRVLLREELLAKMVNERLLGKSMKECILIQWRAEKEDVPLSVEITFARASSKKYISVYEPKTSYYCKLGRVVVTYNGEKNTWDCPCNRTKQSCIHKAVARWHLFQTQQALFKKGKSTECANRTPETQKQSLGVESDPGMMV